MPARIWNGSRVQTASRAGVSGNHSHATCVNGPPTKPNIAKNTAAPVSPTHTQATLTAAEIAAAEQALSSMDRERRADLTIQANRALLDDMGVIPVMYLRYNWASRADRVRYLPSYRGFTSAIWAKPVP